MHQYVGGGALGLRGVGTRRHATLHQLCGGREPGGPAEYDADRRAQLQREPVPQQHPVVLLQPENPNVREIQRHEPVDGGLHTHASLGNTANRP